MTKAKCLTRVNDGLVSRLEQHPQHGIHAFRLLLVHAKERRIKVFQVLLLDLAETRWQVVQSTWPPPRIIIHHIHAVEQVVLELLNVGAFRQTARDSRNHHIVVDVPGIGLCGTVDVAAPQVTGNATSAASGVIVRSDILESGRHLAAVCFSSLRQKSWRKWWV